MTIDPIRLADAVELMTGRNMDAATAETLARVLGVEEEVLPWLVLKQNALADLPEARALLDDHAARLATPLTRRSASLAVSGPVIPIDRNIEDALRQLIAEDIARTELTQEIDALMVDRNAASPDRLDRAFRFRIGGND